MKLLIVDDSRAMRLIIKKTLRRAGVKPTETVEAENGAQALELCQQGPPDLILCDWHMPEMSGIDLLRALRKEGITTDFGFITSESTDDMREMAKEEGAAFLLAKPFTPDALSDALSAVL